MCFFKKKNKKIEEVNYIRISVMALFEYPDLYDGGKIAKNFGEYFEKYFENNEHNNSVYDDFHVMIGNTNFWEGEKIQVDVIFESAIDKTINQDKATSEWKTYISNFFNGDIKNISVRFQTEKDRKEDFDSKMDLLKKLDDLLK